MRHREMDLADERLRKLDDQTGKKRRLLQLLRAGESQAVIAERLGITVRTVKLWVEELGLKRT